MTRYRYSSVFLAGVAAFSGTSDALNLGSSEKIIVSPSVAKADFLNLGRDLSEAVAGGAEWLHFSVQDGRMVPKISFGAPVVAACRDAFPDTVFDVKLGCIEPEHRISDFVKAGADILSVHPESTLQLGAVINMIDKAGVAPGVVLNPGTPVSTVQHVLDQCQVAVVMLVNPGYGGPKYLDVACEKIRMLRQLKPDLHVSVDGGVSEKNAAQLIAAGANVLVAGGGVFKAEDKRAAIANLKCPAYANGSSVLVGSHNRSAVVP
jgi:ribulose-phosphate 3-epimerase